MRICTVKECDRKHVAKGYCKKHYQRWVKYGDPLYIKQVKTCSIDGCGNKHSAKGYCDRHYYTIWYKNEYPDRYNKWYKEHPNHGKQYYKEHKEKIKSTSEEYNKNNPDKCTEYKSLWDNKYPEKRLIIMVKHLEKYGKTFNMTSMEYKNTQNVWAKTIKKLDNNMCKLCDSTKNLHAHHIYPKSLFPELALDLDNGVTLCHDCHWGIHGKIKRFIL